MALNTASIVSSTPVGAFMLTTFQVALGTDYTTGGVELTPSFLKVNAVDQVLPGVNTSLPLDDTRMVVYNPVLNKMVACTAGTGTHSALSTADLSGIVFQFCALTH